MCRTLISSVFYPSCFFCDKSTINDIDLSSKDEYVDVICCKIDKIEIRGCSQLPSHCTSILFTRTFKLSCGFMQILKCLLTFLMISIVTLTTCVYIHQSTFIQMDNSNPFYFFYSKKPLFLCMCAHSCFSFYRKWPTADLAKKYYRCTYIVFRYDYKRIWKFKKRNSV